MSPALNFEYDIKSNIVIWLIFWWKKIGQFGQNWVKKKITVLELNFLLTNMIFLNKNKFATIARSPVFVFGHKFFFKADFKSWNSKGK